MPWFLTLVLILLLARTLAQLALEALNNAHAARHAGTVPAVLAGVVDAAAYARSVDYTRAKGRFASFAIGYDAVVLALILVSGVLPRLWAPVDALAPGAAWSGALFLVLCGLLLTLPGLPLDWWGQFRLEQRFGFNQSTPRLWVADQVKTAALAVVIGFPLAWALLAVVRWAGAGWWIWGFALLFGFQLLMIVLYPKLILPLFNKLTPLAEGPLRDALLALSDRAGFRARTIEVMDGSKRSSHSNAFFTGFGRFRRIVLFDTLVGQLAQSELEAVLAHEIGHYKCGHIPRRLIVGGLLQLGGLAAIGWLAREPWFNTAFGLPAGAMAPAFLLFGLLGGLVSFWFTPVGNWFSRRHEYEADAFAARALGSPEPLRAALRKIYRENLSNLTPHPLYSAVHYSHPTLLEREAALSR